MLLRYPYIYLFFLKTPRGAHFERWDLCCCGHAIDSTLVEFEVRRDILDGHYLLTHVCCPQLVQCHVGNVQESLF